MFVNVGMVNHIILLIMVVTAVFAQNLKRRKRMKCDKCEQTLSLVPYLKQWKGTTPKEYRELCKYIVNSWWPDYKQGGAASYRTKKGILRLGLATCGWSENEEIVSDIQANSYISYHWKKSESGGLHIYEFKVSEAKKDE
jgi:hypothetical protein